MKKVLHLITGLEKGGGAENMLLKTLPYLKKTENRVCCIRGHGEIGEKLEQRGVLVHYLDAKRKYNPGVIWRYKGVIRDFKPDLQVNYLIHADLFGRFFGKTFGVKKIVAYIRNKHLDLPFLLKMDKLTSNLVDYHLTNSVSTLNYYRQNLKIKLEKSHCIPNGINLEDFQINIETEKKRREVNLTPNDFVISNVARLYSSKRQIDILQALKLLNNSKIKLLLIGTGDQEGLLKNFVKENNLDAQVRFLGLRNDVLEILQATDLFVLPSMHEGMSNALLEAMTMKRPCLVSDIEENIELIKHNLNGMNFRTADYKDLAEKINFAINNIERMKDFGHKARETVEKNYNIKKIIAQLDDFLYSFI